MVDIKDPQNNSAESQQIELNNNGNTVNNDSAIDNQTKNNPKELHDDTIYDNMIFPS